MKDLSMTIFSIPKAFTGKTSILQKKAIKSWLNLSCKPKVVLFGNDEGVKEVCEELGLIHVSNIKKNEYGNYYLDDVFGQIKENTEDDFLCYVNADIIFTNKIEEAIQKTKEDKKIRNNNFLIVGSRFDFDSGENSEFDEKKVLQNGVVHPPWGSDFFIFSRNIEIEMPPFVVGRPYWDNWFIFFFKKNKIPVIDITNFTLVFHQNHDYNHVKDKTGYKWEGPEADINKRLMNNTSFSGNTCFNLGDATYKLNNEGLSLNINRRIIIFYLRSFFFFRMSIYVLKIFKNIIYKSIRLSVATVLVSIFFLVLVLRLENTMALILYLPIQYIMLVQVYTYLKIQKKIETESGKILRLIKLNKEGM